MCVSLPMTIPAVPSWMVLNSAAESRKLEVLGEAGSVISIGLASAAVELPVASTPPGRRFTSPVVWIRIRLAIRRYVDAIPIAPVGGADDDIAGGCPGRR